METKAEVWIPLTQGKVAVIDFDDFEKVRGIKWQAWVNNRTSYARRVKRTQGVRLCLSLHSLIFGTVPKGFEIAHRDGDGLNCRRDNLTGVTHTQNMQGKCGKKHNATSIFRGVRLTKFGRWQARITVNRKCLYLGQFKNEFDAAGAYDIAARKHFGKHAAPNFSANESSQME